MTQCKYCATQDKLYYCERFNGLVYTSLFVCRKCLGKNTPWTRKQFKANGGKISLGVKGV